MPTTREEHITYTRNELNNYRYYIDVFNILKNENINSYIDIGANVGEFCNVITEKLPTLKKSFLFEPEVNNFNFLKKNINPKLDVQLFNYAIGYGFKNPILNNNSNVGGFFITEGHTNSNIIVKSLEELNLPDVDLIKMDIEGGEFNVIENSSYLKKIKLLEIEFHQTPKQVEGGFIPNYLKVNLPNYELLTFDTNTQNLYGRCLLKKIN